MGYKLKQSCPAYSPMDGERAGVRYEHGMEYENIPPGDADNFEAAQEDVRPAAGFGRKSDKEKSAEEAEK